MVRGNRLPIYRCVENQGTPTGQSSCSLLNVQLGGIPMYAVFSDTSQANWDFITKKAPWKL